MTDNSEEKPTRKRRKRKKKIANWMRLLILFTFLSFILLIVFFSSSLSRVQKISVSGNELVDAQQIIAASGIRKGDQYLLVGQETTSENIKKLGSVRSVKLQKTFPGNIRLVVDEFPKVAFILHEDGRRECVLANGKRLPVSPFTMPDKPLLKGWNVNKNDQLLQNMTEALASIEAAQLSDLSEILPTPTRSYPDKIRIYTRSGYEIITTIGYLPKKIVLLQGIIRKIQADKKTSGYIFMMGDKIYHRPFESIKSTDKNPKDTTQNEN